MCKTEGRQQKYIVRLISQANAKLKQKQQEERKEKVKEKNLKLVFAMFYEIFIFHQMIALQKL